MVWLEVPQPLVTRDMLQLFEVVPLPSAARKKIL
jgi:hypothetical protein